MKVSIKRVSAACAALCLLFWAGCRKSGGSPGDDAEFNPEMSQGQVRVVLLRATPYSFATNPPAFCVTYVVAVPTNGAFSDLKFSSHDEIVLSTSGKPIELKGGMSSTATGFADLPRQGELRQPVLQDGMAMLAQDLTFPDLTVDATRMDIRLRFSWRGTPLSFEFENVPVGYRNGGPGQ